jgi:type 2 lantibiotic biosynthesis protein LanM
MPGDAPQADWHLAEPLTERVAAQRVRRRDSAGPPESERAFRWRAEFPFGPGQLFAQRLAACNIEEAEFLAAVDDATFAPSDAPAPAWARTLAGAYLNPKPASASVLAGLSPSPTDALFPFLRCAAPLIDHFAEALRDNAIRLAGDDLPVAYDPHTVHRMFLGELLDAYKRMLAPTLLLELNLARLSGRLAGDSPAERFGGFVAGLDDRATALQLLKRYPVLARQLVVRGEQWLSSSVAFLGDLAEDWPAISDWLDRDWPDHGAPVGRLTAVQAQLGDSHRGGRSVIAATFDSGLHLVYKPRSLAVDGHFQQLLDWIGGRVEGLTFKTLRILDRGTRGWVEFVRPADCHSAGAVRRFYERQGGYLALLHLLNGSDFHCENVIAAGEHPVLVDLEAMFHARVPTDGHGVHGVALQAWETTVLRTGLLPTPMRWADDGQHLDRSGLGAPQTPPSPLGVLCPEAAGTDEMRLVRKRLPIRPSTHWPTLAGRPVDRIDADAVVAGFTKVYRALMAHRTALLDADGPVARFHGDETRIVLRHTLVYTRLLSESFHPDVLHDALDRDRLFDLLWADVPDSPHLSRVVADECRDLWNGDVPLFHGRVGSRGIASGSGRIIPDFLPEPTDAPVRRRLAHLSEADLDRQAWFIRAALATLEPERVTVTSDARLTVSSDTAHTTQSRLLAQAYGIGDRLAALALRSGGEAGWIGLRHLGKDDWSVGPVGPDLYDGTAGIVLFLAYLGAVTGEPRYRRLAAAGARNLRSQVAALPPAALGIGAFAGWGGLIYLYSSLALMWDQPQWLDEARRMIDTVRPLIEHDTSHDLMGGAAGCIAGLVAMHAVAPSEDLLAVATACGNQLLRSAGRAGPGIGWPSTLFRVPLAGLSHGASGIAAALLDLNRLTGQTRFRDAATAALDYERSLFDSEQGHWADLRPREERRPSRTPMVAWCHGAAGIGLSRLSMLSEPDALTARREIARAVDATLAGGFGDNHCLCHGDLGNLDLLVQAGQAMRHRAWDDAAERRTLAILDDVEHHGWRCGINKPVGTPGLMTGLAGIGYGMLRLACPSTVPPVTTLSPPQITASRG